MKIIFVLMFIRTFTQTNPMIFPETQTCESNPSSSCNFTLDTVQFSETGIRSSLEITPNGNLRTETEIDSIMYKKIAHRQKLHKELHASYRTRSKERALQRSKTYHPADCAESETEDEVMHSSRSHIKRSERKNLRREARMITKSLLRSREYKKLSKGNSQESETSDLPAFANVHVIPNPPLLDLWGLPPDTPLTHRIRTMAFEYHRSFMESTYLARFREIAQQIQSSFVFTPGMVGQLSIADLIVNYLCYLRILIGGIFIPKEFIFGHLMSCAYLWCSLLGLPFSTKAVLVGGAGVLFKLLEAIIEASLEYFGPPSEDSKQQHSESASDVFNSFLTGIINFSTSPLVTALRNLFVFLAAMHVFEKPVSNDIFRTLGKPEGGSIMSMLISSLGDLVTLIRCGESWITGKTSDSSTAFLFSVNPCVAALGALSEHLEYRNYTYSGLPIEGYQDRQTYVTKLRSLIEELEKHQDSVSKVEQKKLNVSAKLIEAKKVLNDFHGSLIGSFRAAPLAFVIHGPPGTGKSQILKLIAYIMSKVKKREFSEKLIHTRQSEFWEGYNGISHPYVHYSEAGKMANDIAKKKGDTLMDELLSVIDNLAYPCNMAFEGKGKTFAIPELVLIDTNNKDMNLPQLYENYAAFMRRFIYIIACPRAEFAKGGVRGGPIDKFKAEGKGTNVWDFTVSIRHPTGNKTYTEEILLNAGSDDDLLKLLVPMMMTHIQFESRMAIAASSGTLFSGLDDTISKLIDPQFAVKTEGATIDESTLSIVYPENSKLEKFNLFSNPLRRRLSDAYARVTGQKIRDLANLKLDETKSNLSDSSDSKTHEDPAMSDVSSEIDTESTSSSSDKSKQSDDKNPDSESLRKKNLDALVDYYDLDDEVSNMSEISMSLYHARQIVEESVPIVLEIDDPNQCSISEQLSSEFEEFVAVAPSAQITALNFVATINSALELEDEKAATEMLAEAHVPGKMLYDYIVRTVPAETVTTFARSQGMLDNFRITYEEINGKKVACLRVKLLMDMRLGVIDTTTGVIKISGAISPFIKTEDLESYDIYPMFYKVCRFHEEELQKQHSEFSSIAVLSFLDIMSTVWYVLPYVFSMCSALWALVIVATFEIFMRSFGSGWSLCNLSIQRMFVLGVVIFLTIMGWYDTLIIYATMYMMSYSVQGALTTSIRTTITKLRNEYIDGAHYGFHRIMIAFGQRPRDAIPRNNFTVLWTFSYVVGGAALAATGFYGLWRFFNSDESRENVLVTEIPPDSPSGKTSYSYEPIVRSNQYAETTFSKMTPSKEELIVKENRFGCGPSYQRIPNKLNLSQWNVKVMPVPVFSGKVDELYNLAMRNLRKMTVYNDRGDILKHGHVFGIFGNWAITNLHAFEKIHHGKTVMISSTGDTDNDLVMKPTLLCPSNSRALSNDLMLISLNQIRFKNLMEFIPELEEMPDMSSDSYTSGKVLTAIKRTVPPVILDKIFGTLPIVNSYAYTLQNRVFGHCGHPLIMGVGKGAVITAIHSGGNSEGECTAATISIKEIKDAILDIEKSREFCPMDSVSETSEELIVVETAPKSVVNFVPIHGANYMGKLPGPIVRTKKSKVTRTPLPKDEVRALFSNIFQYVPSTEFGPPTMSFVQYQGEWISPEVNFARKIGQQKNALNMEILNLCIAKYVGHVTDELQRQEVSLSPWDIETSINGAKHDAYARKMDMNKSAGFGRAGSKRNFFEFVEIDDQLIAEPDTKLADDVRNALEAYEQGYSLRVIYKACLKDEPRDVKKIAKAKTRVFCVSPLVNLIITRMFFGPIFSLMVEQGKLFCVGIGSDMHRDAHDIYGDWIAHSQHGIEFDYGNYDQTMPYEIGWAAGSVVYRICQIMGYNSLALKIVAGLVSDNLHPFVVLDMDIFELPGYQPSGKYGTAEDNCIRGVLMLMYFFYTHEADNVSSDLSFFEEVCVYVYGDDVAGTVSDITSSWFNNITYARFCEKFIGLECTPATKDAEFSEFMPLDKISFLKRTFVHHEGVNRIVAKLDMASLVKTLEWYIPSLSVSTLEQVLSASSSVIREIYFHSTHSQYDLFRDGMIELMIDTFSISRSTIEKNYPSFVSLTNDFLCPKTRPVIGGRQDTIEEVEDLGDSKTYDDSHLIVAQEDFPAVKEKRQIAEAGSGSVRPGTEDQRTSVLHLLYKIKNLENEEKKLSSEPVDNPIQGMSPYLLRRSPLYMNDPNFMIAVQQYQTWVASLEAIQKTIKLLQNEVDRISVEMYSESGEETKTSTDTETQTVNVRDLGGMETKVDYLPSSHLLELDHSDVPLDSFLSRPILVDKFSISLNGAVFKSYDLYDELLGNNLIRMKLRNYAFFRADIRIRVSISGTQFHQGRAIIAWIPWYNQTNNTKLSMTIPSVGLRAASMSTMPQHMYIDIRQNEPVEMVIPFVHVQPMGRLFNPETPVIPLLTNLKDFADMGKFIFLMMNPAETVSTGATAPYCQIYASFENVKVSVPTGTVMLAESDERKVGPVEKWASSSAKLFAAVAKHVPIVPYMKASEMAAKTTATLAAHMGWSKPILDSPVQGVKNEPFQCAANTSMGERAHKLTLDQHQELTVDPSVVSVTEDELTISHLCSKQTFLRTFDWQVADPIMAPILKVAVHPRVVQPYFATPNTYIQPSPMAFVASQFVYWHGDITFDFDVVKTSFHRGKFAVMWEPNIPQNDIIEADINLNKQYVYIVDLQELEKFSVKIKWNGPQAWFEVPNAGNSKKSILVTEDFGTDPNFVTRQCNGYLMVVPITSLQSPEDKSVHINMFIRSDNMRFAVPSSAAMNQTMVAESGSEYVTIDLNTAGSSENGISEYHFGEQAVSMRTIFKRYRTHLDMSKEIPVALSGIVRIVYPTIPLLTQTAGADAILTQWRNCFVGMRGGFKYRIRLQLSAPMQPTSCMTVSMEGPSILTPTTIATSTVLQTRNFLTGSTTFIPYTQPGIEVEIPYFNTALFSFAQPVISNPANTSYNIASQMRTWQLAFQTYGAVTGWIMIDVATGEDFNFLGFLKAPMFIDNSA